MDWMRWEGHGGRTKNTNKTDEQSLAPFFSDQCDNAACVLAGALPRLSRAGSHDVQVSASIAVST